MYEEKLLPFVPDQMTVTVYEPGAGIAPHVDCHSAFGVGIAALSLGSDSVMNFAAPGKDLASFDIVLRRRALLIMRDEARYLYTHCIRERKFDRIDGEVVPRGTRVSLTFRLVRTHIRCSCLSNLRRFVSGQRLEPVSV